jgi:hypothetical protein
MLPTWWLYDMHGPRSPARKYRRELGVTAWTVSRTTTFSSRAYCEVWMQRERRKRSVRYTLQTRAHDSPSKREGNVSFRVAAERTCACHFALPREKSVVQLVLFLVLLHLHRLEPVLAKLLLRFTRAPFHQRCCLVACPRVSRRAGSSLSPASRLQHAPPWPQP